MEPVPTDSNDQNADPSQQDANAEDQAVDPADPGNESAQPVGDTQAGSSDADSSTGGSSKSESNSTGGSAEPAAEQEAVQTVSQDDIDALLNAASGEVDDEAAKTDSQPDVDALLNAASGEVDPQDQHQEANAPKTEPFEMQDLSLSPESSIDPKRVSMLNDVNLRVRIELGRTKMLVEDVLKLDKGSVVELDKLAGDPVDVFVNDRLIARGEVLVLNDNFCVRINEVLSHDPHRVSA